MPDVRLAPKAEDDLAAIWDYSNRSLGPDAASTYLRGFNEVFDKLADFPQLGAIIDGIIPTTRSFGHRQHRLFYRIDSDRMLVVRILHKAQNSQAFSELS